MAVSKFTGAGPTFEDLATPGFATEDPETWPSHMKAAARFKMAGQSEEITPLDAIASSIADHLRRLSGEGQSFMLAEPRNLTILRKDGSVRKRGHIGGEEFAFVDAWVGKKGKLIYKFKPLAVADYEFVELMATEAQECMSGLKAAISSAFDVGELKEMAEAQKRAAIAAEQAALTSRSAQYDNFGSW